MSMQERTEQEGACEFIHSEGKGLVNVSLFVYRSLQSCHQPLLQVGLREIYPSIANGEGDDHSYPTGVHANTEDPQIFWQELTERTENKGDIKLAYKKV